MIKKFEDYRKLNEANSDFYLELKIQLERAASIAEKIGIDAQDNPENYEGWEGNKISELLNKVYAGFMTGNKKDISRNDEIFKR